MVGDAARDLESARRRWMGAVNAGDVSAYASIVSHDVVWLPPGGKVIRGRAEFRDWITPLMSGHGYQFTAKSIALEIADPHACELGRYRSVFAPLGGGPEAAHEGQFVAWWHFEDDRTWRIQRYADLGQTTLS